MGPEVINRAFRSFCSVRFKNASACFASQKYSASRANKTKQSRTLGATSSLERLPLRWDVKWNVCSPDKNGVMANVGMFGVQSDSNVDMLLSEDMFLYLLRGGSTISMTVASRHVGE